MKNGKFVCFFDAVRFEVKHKHGKWSKVMVRYASGQTCAASHKVKSSQSRDFDFVLKKKVQVITQRYRTFKLITVQYVLLKNGTVL